MHRRKKAKVAGVHKPLKEAKTANQQAKAIRAEPARQNTQAKAAGVHKPVKKAKTANQRAKAKPARQNAFDREAKRAKEAYLLESVLKSGAGKTKSHQSGKAPAEYGSWNWGRHK